jgi:hypothetical protein
MIDSQSEQIVTLAQAADSLPRRRRGRKTHVSCLYRWAKVGHRGVLLETLQIGGTRCTSKEALQRFFERLSESRQAGSGSSSARPAPFAGRRSPSRRQRDSEKAERVLIERGA